MAGELVLITGGNGHIGFRTLVFALEAGYRVRAAVRSQIKADAILAAPSLRRLAPTEEQLSFIIVPDMLAAGAYDEAIRGVDSVIHIASPITSGIKPEQYETGLIQPAREGTLAILEVAHKTGSQTVKRVVIMSSVIAHVPITAIFKEEDTHVFTEADSIPFDNGPYMSEAQAYAASKVAARLAAVDFMEKHKPDFDVVNIAPSFVFGKDELVTSKADATRGTNGFVLGGFLGNKSPLPKPNTTVHVDDVAHISGIVWEDTLDIVARNFPEAVAKGILPNDASTRTHRVKIDASNAERFFGLSYKGFEEQVCSVVGHYLELVSAGS